MSERVPTRYRYGIGARRHCCLAAKLTVLEHHDLLRWAAMFFCRPQVDVGRGLAMLDLITSYGKHESLEQLGLIEHAIEKCTPAARGN